MLRFSVLQEELTGLKKAVIFMVTMCYFERTYTKISKWKKYIGYLKSRGDTKCKLPSAYSREYAQFSQQ